MCCVWVGGREEEEEEVKEATYIEPSQDLIIHHYKGVQFGSNNALTQ
jgi:hypothetical protein